MVPKVQHEIRDPIHTFVHLDSNDRRVLDSRPFQRLRHITQLALSYLVYPGATHRRFEHSLGVMELAGRAFDVLTADANIEQVRDLVPDLSNQDGLTYWKRVLRMAALCHDIGHLPFSHAAEGQLPAGWSHEKLSRILIESEDLKSIWDDMIPPLKVEHIVKVAVGPAHAPDLIFSQWEQILHQIIGGDAFGVDRIDYLLRDSYHAGVAYGKFDHYRLLDELRLLPAFKGSDAAALGIREGGIHSAEALALARYFMYSQVYYHPVRLIYNLHLQDFVSVWLADSGGCFPIDVEGHLSYTDNEINAAMRVFGRDPKNLGYDSAARILEHRHFKVLYSQLPDDLDETTEPGAAVLAAAKKEFGEANVRRSNPKLKGIGTEFPVLTRNGTVEPAMRISETLAKLRPSAFDYVFVEGTILEKARAWLAENRAAIMKEAGEREDKGE